MKSIVIIFTAILAIAGCTSRSSKTDSEEDMIENGRIGYADIVSFIVQGYQCKWDGMSPEDQGLSPVYSYSSEFAGFAEKDIDGNGIPELLIGDRFEDGDYLLYDIYTINPSDGSLIHLAKGGERDTYKVNGSGIIIESGSNSAFDSFQKCFRIKNGELVELKGDNTAWEESLLKLDIENFASLASLKHLVGAFGEQREISDEEMEMFRKATAGESAVVYTPLSVSTQVVAGINYRFWTRFEDLSDGIQRKSADDSDKYGYCWITIFKPLPGQGEPRVTAIDKDGSRKDL